MRIRAATEADAAAVAAIWTEAYSGRHPEGRQAPYEESEFFEPLRGGAVLVAVEVTAGEEVVLGVAVLYPVDAPEKAVARPGEAELASVAVAETSRRRGIGWALVQRCIERAQAWGASAIALWSRPHQVEAHRLYESLGYRRVPERDSRDPRDGRRIFVLELADRR